MSNASRNVAIVTGASGAIGAATVAQLLKHGYAVYGTSQNSKPGQSSVDGFVLRTLDVRDERAIGALVDDVMREAGRIDLLVNNAGATLVGALEETTLAETRDLFDVNFFGAVSATTSVLPHMRAARRGRIVFVSSVLGFLPAPFMGIYAASKHALEGYAESLDHEVRAFGIRSILVEPSFTATAFMRNRREASRRLPAYATARARVFDKLAEETDHGARPEAAADALLAAVSATTPKLRYPVGNANSLRRLRCFRPGVDVRCQLPAPIRAGRVK